LLIKSEFINNFTHCNWLIIRRKQRKQPNFNLNDICKTERMVYLLNRPMKPTAQNNRIWMITGTSRGFGAEIAKSALAAGDTVIGTGRKAEDVTKNLGASERLFALSLDVCDPASIAAAVDAAIARYAHIDVLVNNAGFGVLGGVEETSAEETERVFKTNVFGLLNVTRAVLPHMRARRSGHILNFSSIGGYQSF